MDQRREGERRPTGIDRDQGRYVGSTWRGRTLLLYRVDLSRAPAVRELIPSASPGASVEVLVED